MDWSATVNKSHFLGLSAVDKDLNLMLSVILLGASVWLGEKLSSFKRKSNALIEKLFLSNLFVIFAINISQYDYITDIMITVLISLAMFQLACIVILHAKISLFESFPKYEILFDFSIVSLKFCKYFKTTRSVRHDFELASIIPEKTYNYEEFQEPVVGIGHN